MFKPLVRLVVKLTRLLHAIAIERRVQDVWETHVKSILYTFNYLNTVAGVLRM